MVDRNRNLKLQISIALTLKLSAGDQLIHERCLVSDPQKVIQRSMSSGGPRVTAWEKGKRRQSSYWLEDRWSNGLGYEFLKRWNYNLE